VFSGCFWKVLKKVSTNWLRAAQFFSAFYPQVFESHSIIIVEINGMAHNL
jgi:hypothetical protein